MQPLAANLRDPPPLGVFDTFPTLEKIKRCKPKIDKRLGAMVVLELQKHLGFLLLKFIDLLFRAQMIKEKNYSGGWVG